MAAERYGKRIPSEREYRVIELVAEGFKNKEVADRIGTTEHVVKNYLRVIYDKLGLWNRVELALWHEARQFERATQASRGEVLGKIASGTGRELTDQHGDAEPRRVVTATVNAASQGWAYAGRTCA